MSIRKCVICGKSFNRRGKRIAYTCSLKCKKLFLSKKMIGIPKVKKGIYQKCKMCNNEIYVHPSKIGRHRYCSMKCRNKDLHLWNRGDKNIHWKGGRTILSGYIYIKCYDHPNRNNGDYVAEHRLVMEKHLGRYLTNNEEVHHKNGIKTDNRIENLELVIKKLHFGEVMCPHCNKKFKIK